MSYTATELISVYSHHGGETMLVGRLANQERRVLFEYDPTFLIQAIQLSPFMVPLKPGVQQCDDHIFDGLFGLFNDSLPDGWGRLLLDRVVEAAGINRRQISALDRLAYVGNAGMGALSYVPNFSTYAEDIPPLQLDKLFEDAKVVLTGDGESVIKELLQLSGSSAGARPKIVAQVSKDKKSIIHGRNRLQEGYSHWMVKFAASNDPSDIGAIEYAYAQMAQEAGIVMPTVHLFEQSGGAGYFGVERFDRLGDIRVHTHSLCGLIHADFRRPSLDYEMVLKVTQLLSRNMVEVRKAFRLACFNVFAHNRDDHSKNFSYILNLQNEWQLSPAYDLTFSYGPAGEHSTMVMGEGKYPSQDHLQKLAARFGIGKSDAKNIIDQVYIAVINWLEHARNAGVTQKSQQNIASLISK